MFFLLSNSVTREYFNYLPTERTIQNEVHQTQATLKWRRTPVSYPNSNFLCYRPSQLLLITSTKSVLSYHFINHQSRSQAKVKVQLISRGRERITQHTCITFDFEQNVPSTGFSFNFLIFLWNSQSEIMAVEIFHREVSSSMIVLVWIFLGLKFAWLK